MKKLVLLLSIFIFVGTNFSFAEEKYDYINISNPFLKKIPIAIPSFKLISEKKEEKKLAEEAVAILKETLSFTNYFYILKDNAFLEEPKEVGIVSSKINFVNWTTIGCELLVTGGILVKRNKVKIELRLFDTFKKTMLSGKVYEFNASDLKETMRCFATDMIEVLTGRQSFFSSKIAFVSSLGQNKEIYITDFDGLNSKKITNFKNITMSPAWSYDNKALSYVSYINKKPAICIKYINRNKSYILDFQTSAISPVWMPKDDDILAATLLMDNKQEIYLLNTKGKILEKLTESLDINVSPTFSPDGKKMAYVSTKSGSPQIYLMDIKKKKTKRITYSKRYNQSPTWSPDGKKIAFVALTKHKNLDIFVMDTNGRNVRQLTFNSKNNESPTWSPDSNYIAFSSNRTGKYKIYFMTITGHNTKCVTCSLKGEQTEPAWSDNFGRRCK